MRQFGNGDTDGGGNQQNRKNVGRQERRNRVVGDNGCDVVKVALAFDACDGG